MTLGELALKIVLKAQGLSDILKIKKDVENTAKDVKPKTEGIKSSWSSLGKIFENVGKKSTSFYKDNKSGLKDLMGFVIPSTLAMKLGLIAVISTITTFVKKVSDVAAELTKFTNLTGLSSQKLQALQQQAAASGVAIEDVTSSVESLQRASQDIALGKGNIAPWAMLGIDPNQDPFEVLTKLQSKLKGFSAARGAALASELGLSRDMINFLREANSIGGSDKELLLSDKEIRKLKTFNIEFNKTWDASKRVMQKIAIGLIPIANFAMYAWNRIIIDMKAVGKGLETLGDKYKSFWKIMGVIGAALMIYFMPLVSAVVGIGLLLNDFGAYSRGEDSIIGALVNWFKQWKEILSEIIPMLKYALELVKEFGIEKFNKLKESLGFGDAKGNNKLPSQIGQVIPIGGSKQTSNNTQTNNINVNVNGSKNDEDLAKKISEKVKGVMGNTMYQQPLGATK